MIDQKIKEQIKKAVLKYIGSDYKIFIFGSRTSDHHGRFSDLDLGISGEKSISGKQMVLLKEALENSPIPYKIDVVDFRGVSEEFRQVALQKINYL